MNILVINCGSSSLKFQLINSDTEAVLAKGICERIGAAGSQMVYKPSEGEKLYLKICSYFALEFKYKGKIFLLNKEGF